MATIYLVHSSCKPCALPPALTGGTRFTGGWHEIIIKQWGTWPYFMLPYSFIKQFEV